MERKQEIFSIKGLQKGNLINCLLREQILNTNEVGSHIKTLTFEDGYRGKPVASVRICQCINDIKVIVTVIYF